MFHIKFYIGEFAYFGDDNLTCGGKDYNLLLEKFIKSGMSWVELTVALEGLRDALDEFSSHPSDTSIRSRIIREYDRVKLLYSEIKGEVIGSYHPRFDSVQVFQLPWVSLENFVSILVGTFVHKLLHKNSRLGLVSHLVALYRFAELDINERIPHDKLYINLALPPVNSLLTSLIQVPSHNLDVREKLSLIFSTVGLYQQLFSAVGPASFDSMLIERTYKLHFSE